MSYTRKQRRQALNDMGMSERQVKRWLIQNDVASIAKTTTWVAGAGIIGCWIFGVLVPHWLVATFVACLLIRLAHLFSSMAFGFRYGMKRAATEYERTYSHFSRSETVDA